MSLEIVLIRWNQNFFVSRPIFCLASLDRLIDPGTPTDLELDCRVRKSLCDGSWPTSIADRDTWLPKFDPGNQ